MLCINCKELYREHKTESEGPMLEASSESIALCIWPQYKDDAGKEVPDQVPKLGQ